MDTNRRTDWIIFFAIILALGIGVGYALYTPNPEMGTPNETTNACELNASLVGNNVYYDNQSKVCWKPVENQTQPVNESVNKSG